MAKVKYGAIVGQVSGSIGASTHGHNRFGNYIRQRSIPVQPNTGLQLAQRAVLGTESAAWANLLAAQRKSWAVWSQNNPIVDVLGDKRILTGHMAFVMCNSRLKQIALPTFDTPPAKATPTALTTLSLTATVSLQDCNLTFTPSPLWSGGILWIRGCKTPTASINYVKNLFRFVEAAAPTNSPYNCTLVADVLGTLALGERIILWVSRMDSTTGLISPPREARCTVTA